MSVRLKERKTSAVQYIEIARQLWNHTITNCKKFPKSIMFFVTKRIAEIANDIYINTVKANAIYPKTQLDIEIRYKYLTGTGKIIKKPNKKNIVRMRRKLKSFKIKVLNGAMDIEDVKRSYVSWLGCIKKLNANKTINSMRLLYNSLFGGS